MSVAWFAVLGFYPLLAGGSMEKIRIGYGTTLRLCAVSRPDVRQPAHVKMGPRGGLHQVLRKACPSGNGRFGRPSNDSP